MAPIKPERKSAKKPERPRAGAKRLLDACGGDEDEDDGPPCDAKRLGCISTCEAKEAATTGTTAAAAAQSTTPCQPPASAPASALDTDIELRALVPYLSQTEARVLASLEMNGPMLRAECPRCSAKGGGGGAGAGAGGEECLCCVQADDHYFRDARAHLARQIREAARQRMNAAGHGIPKCDADSFFSTPNRQQDNASAGWDWLTQVQTCVPSTAQQPSSAPPMPMDTTPRDGAVPAFGIQQPMGNRPQFMAPRPLSEPGPATNPSPWGFSSSTTALHGAPFPASPPPYLAQQSSFQQLNFGQGAPPSFAPAQQPPPPPPQPGVAGYGVSFGQPSGQGGGFGQPPGQGGGFGQPPGQAGGGFGQPPGQAGGGFGQPPGQGGGGFGQPPGQGGGGFGQQGAGGGFGQQGGGGFGQGGGGFGQSPAQGGGFGQPGQGGGFGQQAAGFGQAQGAQFMGGQEAFMGGQFAANQYPGLAMQGGFPAAAYGPGQPYAGGPPFAQAQFGAPQLMQPSGQYPCSPNQGLFAGQQAGPGPFVGPAAWAGPCMPQPGPFCPHMLCGPQVH